MGQATARHDHVQVRMVRHRRTPSVEHGGDVVGKRLEFLREVVPGLRRLAILGNVSYPSTALEMGEVQTMATTLGIAATKVEIRRLDMRDLSQLLAHVHDAEIEIGEGPEPARREGPVH